MEQAQVDVLSKDHNVSYEPEGSFNIMRDGKWTAPWMDASDVEVLIVRNKTNVDKQVIDVMGRLKVIGRLGVGLDNIDVEYCKEKKVPVLTADGANARSVNEYVIMGLLTLFRKTMSSTESILKGNWHRNEYIGSEINGKTLGIIGIGTIGKLVAKNAKNMGMNVIGNDIAIEDNDEIWEQLNVECCSFDDLINQSDAITLHIPLNKDTRNLFGKKEFEKMKKGSFIINTSRGGIIKESELLKYLKNGHLGGAMIDVFESEPVKDSKSFSDIPNLILTPHIAGLTSESNVRVSQTITDQILSFLDNGGRQI